MDTKKFYKIFFFIVIATMGLVISIIYYEFLKIVLPDISLYMFPFNLPSFVFGMTYLVIIPIVVYLSRNKIKKRIQKINKLKSL